MTLCNKELDNCLFIWIGHRSLASVWGHLDCSQFSATEWWVWEDTWVCVLVNKYAKISDEYILRVILLGQRVWRCSDSWDNARHFLKSPIRFTQAAIRERALLCTTSLANTLHYPSFCKVLGLLVGPWHYLHFLSPTSLMTDETEQCVLDTWYTSISLLLTVGVMFWVLAVTSTITDYNL